jgi:hypothetical protein
MKDALKKFALVTFTVLLCLFIAWMYLRNRGLSSQPQEPLNHAFLNQRFPVAVAYTPIENSHFAVRRADLDAWVSLPDSIVLWIPVESTFEGELFVRPLAEAAQDGKRPLADVLRRFPDRKMVLNFLDNRPGLVESIIRIVEETGVGDRILIQSTVDGLLRDLREKQPLWIFGTSRRQVTLAQMLSSIGLEPMSPIRGDVFVFESLPGRHENIPESVVREAKRRGLRVFAGPARSIAEAKALLDKGVDGILTTEPSGVADEVNR